MMNRSILLATCALVLALAGPVRAQMGPAGSTVPAVWEPQPVATVTVTTSATLLGTCVISGTSFFIYNNDLSKTLFVGFNSSVTTSGAAQGISIPPGQFLGFTGMAKGYSLYAISASSTVATTVAEFRRR